jgi:hypothetical protein
MTTPSLTLNTLTGAFELRRPRSAGEASAISVERAERDIEYALREAVSSNGVQTWDLLQALGEFDPSLIFASEATVSTFMKALRWGRLVLARDDGGRRDDADLSWDAYDAFTGLVGREFRVGMRSHLLVSRGRAADLRSQAEYDVVPAAEAQTLISQASKAKRPGLAPAQLETLLKSIVDMRGPADQHGFVLLREPLSHASRAVSTEEVITPAKLKQLADERLKDPRWLASEPSGTRETATSSASIDDTVFLRVTTSKFPLGTAITFVIMDAATREVVATLGGTVGDGQTQDMAHAEWIVPESIESGPVVPDKHEFLVAAEAHGHRCDGGILKVVPLIWELMMQIDPDDPEALDDELILYDANNVEVERIGTAELSKQGDDWVKAKFKNARRLRKYTLIRDHGPDEGGGVDVLFENMSPNELEALSEV